jgi:tRNA(fMet)-specific endonuclease VapC
VITLGKMLNWMEFFGKVDILDLNMEGAALAGNINRELKQEGKLIGVQDILIGAIAKRHQMKLATDNVKHFSRIVGGLELI